MIESFLSFLPFTGDPITSGAQRFLVPMLNPGAATPAASTTEFFMVLPNDCTIYQIYFSSFLQGTVSSPVTGTYTVRKNGSPTSMIATCTKNVNADFWTGESVASPVAFLAGDRLSMSIECDTAFSGAPFGVHVSCLARIVL